MEHLLCLWCFLGLLQILAHLNLIKTSWSKDDYDLFCPGHNSGADDFGNEFMVTHWFWGSRDCNSERLTIEQCSESLARVGFHVLIHLLCSRPWR